MKALRIINCSDPLMWYREFIGMEVVYLGEDNDAKGPIYWSRDGGGYKNIILKQDAELINSEFSNNQLFDQNNYPS